MRSLPSLRLWLQSTVLLTVIAGYSLLFAVQSSLNERERQLLHREQVSRLVESYLENWDAGSLPLIPNFELAVGPAGALVDPVLTTEPNGDHWLESRVRLLPSQLRSPTLTVRQNITSSLEHQRSLQLLLIATAGLSVLLTAALLRVVLWRGLAVPLHDLQRELKVLQADSLGVCPLEPNQQPQELQPIVVAFNDLQKRLAQAWQRERSFVDGVAHELRTPITVISGHAQRLQADASENPTAAVALIAAEAKRLGELIALMLDFARVDAGRLTLDIVELDPEAFLLEAFERLQELAPDRLQLAPSIPVDLPCIRADADRVHQCLAALVENALRYSEGSVQLGVSISPIGVTLHVRDQGHGIPVAERDRVLERFVRGRSSRGSQGSGLGLAIVNDLMRAMQGKLLIADLSAGGADLQLRFKFSDPPPAP